MVIVIVVIVIVLEKRIEHNPLSKMNKAAERHQKGSPDVSRVS